MLFKGPRTGESKVAWPAGRRPDHGHPGQRRRRRRRPCGARVATAGSVSRGYIEELEHWAWCIRQPAPENRPRCHPEVALGDAVIALTTNMAARQSRRIEFQEAWFDPTRPETPEGIAPDVTRYNT